MLICLCMTAVWLQAKANSDSGKVFEVQEQLRAAQLQVENLNILLKEARARELVLAKAVNDLQQVGKVGA